jgi:uncharacterized protein YyaL (SSP411 family)
LLPVAAESAFAHLSVLNALDLRLRAAEIVVTGQAPEAERLLAAARALPFLDRIVLHAPSADALPASHPSRDKLAVAPAAAAAFICVGERCSLPVTQPEQIGQVVGEMRQSSGS